MLVLAVSACAPTKSDEEITRRTVTPGDFVGPAMPLKTNGNTDPIFNHLPEPKVTAVDLPSAGAGDDFTIDAMVGQVNGQALYASQVLEPLAPLLIKDSERMDADVFRVATEKNISKRVEQIVFDALLLGEAERDLSSAERTGVRLTLKQQRSELIRKHGRGSPSVADQTLLEKTGKNLEKTLLEIRQKMIIGRYVQKTIMPKINVSRKDIERYYRSHPEEFNPPTKRVLRLIRVLNEEEAAKVDVQLEDGKKFAEIAADPINRYNASKGGLMEAEGDDVFRQEALNQALVKLKEGERSPRLKIDSNVGPSFWWVYLESVQTKSISLADAQLPIERRMRLQRYQKLSLEYRKQVFRDGSHNSTKEMTRALVEIAMARFKASK